MDRQSGNPIPLHPAQIARACQLLGRAFQDDPMCVFLLPKTEPRRRILPSYMATMVRYCQWYGKVDIIPGRGDPLPGEGNLSAGAKDAASDPVGLAAWLPPGKTETSLWGYLRAGLGVVPLSFGLGNLRRAMAYDAFATRLHHRLAPMPHWYLMLLAVEPESQGQGLGSRLLAPRLARADSAGMPVYLETHNPRNPPFYQKHGFEVVFEGVAPGTSLHFWTMLRKPR